jgi:hypothetical protein
MLGVNPLSWWSVLPGGPLALPTDVAAEWHSRGERCVFLGTYSEALIAQRRLWWSSGSFADSLFDDLPPVKPTQSGRGERAGSLVNSSTGGGPQGGLDEGIHQGSTSPYRSVARASGSAA